MAIYRVFVINTSTEPAPWGAREEQVIKDIIDTLVMDTVGAEKRVAGHLHMDVYDVNGTKIISTRESIDVDITGRDLRVNGPDGYLAPGHRARVAALSRAGGEGMGKFRTGMVCEFKYGLALSVFKWGATGAKMGNGSIDVLKIAEAGALDQGYLGGETGILAEPVPGLTFILERMSNGHLGFKDGASVAHMLYTAASGLASDVPLIAPDFFTGASTWIDWSANIDMTGITGSPAVAVCKYHRVGALVYVNFVIEVEAPGGDITMKLPFKYTRMEQGTTYNPVLGSFLANYSTTQTAGVIVGGTGGDTQVVQLVRADGSSWVYTASLKLRGSFVYMAD